MEVGFQAIQCAEGERALNASLANGVIVTTALAPLTYPVGGKHLVVRTHTFQVMDGLHDWNVVFSQHGEDGGGNLVADVVQVGDIRPLLFQKGVYFPGCVEGIEQTEPKRDLAAERDIRAVVVDFLHEKGSLLALSVSRISGRKDGDRVTSFPEQSLLLEEAGFRPSQGKIELVDQQDLQTAVLLDLWRPLIVLD
jgi:hypothetical protein